MRHTRFTTHARAAPHVVSATRTGPCSPLLPQTFEPEIGSWSERDAGWRMGATCTSTPRLLRLHTPAEAAGGLRSVRETCARQAQVPTQVTSASRRRYWPCRAGVYPCTGMIIILDFPLCSMFAARQVFCPLSLVLCQARTSASILGQ